MKLDDIANLLAEKINQAHYIKHHLNNVFINGFKKGTENSETFAINFLKWTLENQDMEIDAESNIDGLKQLLEIYKKQPE